MASFVACHLLASPDVRNAANHCLGARIMRTLTLLVTITVALVGCSSGDHPATETSGTPIVDAADTVYTNGRIYTVNEAQPWLAALAAGDCPAESCTPVPTAYEL